MFVNFVNQTHVCISPPPVSVDSIYCHHHNTFMVLNIELYIDAINVTFPFPGVPSSTQCFIKT